MMTRKISTGVLCATLLFFTLIVAAADVDLRLTTIGQGYQTRTASGELQDRRRVTQWIDLRAFSLLGDDDLTLESSFRITTEMGQGDSLDEQAGNRAELMQAELSWKRLAGRFDLSLGRQLLLDQLDFLAFDGLRLDAVLSQNLFLRLIGGFSVRERSWLGGEVVELSGVEEGEVPAPVLGASLMFRHELVWAALDYRRIVLWEDGWPLDQELIGTSLSARFWEAKIGLEGGATFDLIRDHWDRLLLDGWVRAPGWFPELIRDLKLAGGYLRSRPRFAMDSIFNFFSPAPFDEFHGGLRWDLGAWLSVNLSYTHRSYQIEDPGIGDGAGGDADGLDLSSRVVIGPDMWAAATLGYEDGAAGRRWIVAPRFVVEFAERFQIDGRGFVTSFEDPVQDNQHALTLGCSAAAQWRFGDRHALVLMAELNTNRIHSMQFRMFAVLDLDFHFTDRRRSL